MEQIATQLGVSQRQISTDLRDLEVSSKSPRPKSASNPKGAGRPKGSGERTNRPRKSDRNKLDEAASLYFDEGLTRDQIVAETGLKVHEVHTTIERERGRREAGIENYIKIDDLPKTYQEKYAVLQRKFEREKERLIKERAEEECKKILDELLPRYQRDHDWAQEIIKSRHGVFSVSEFRTLLMCLHPDRSASDQTLSTMLNKVQKLEGVLVKDEESSPKPRLTFPKTWAEAMEMKRKVTEARKAKRAAARQGQIH